MRKDPNRGTGQREWKGLGVEWWQGETDYGFRE